MTDYLSRLAANAVSSTLAARPRLPSLFEDPVPNMAPFWSAADPDRAPLYRHEWGDGHDGAVPAPTASTTDEHAVGPARDRAAPRQTIDRVTGRPGAQVPLRSEPDTAAADRRLPSTASSASAPERVDRAPPGRETPLRASAPPPVNAEPRVPPAHEELPVPVRRGTPATVPPSPRQARYEPHIQERISAKAMSVTERRPDGAPNPEPFAAPRQAIRLEGERLAHHLDQPPSRRARADLPVIRVTIGRVEVRAAPAPAPGPPLPKPKRPAPTPLLTLSDYLAQRSGGRR